MCRTTIPIAKDQTIELFLLSSSGVQSPPGMSLCEIVHFQSLKFQIGPSKETANLI